MNSQFLLLIPLALLSLVRRTVCTSSSQIEKIWSRPSRRANFSRWLSVSLCSASPCWASLRCGQVDGHLYGTSAAAVAQVRGEGKICVLHLDLAGVEQLRGSSLSPVCVWVTPPSLDALKERLVRRGAAAEDVQARLDQAAQEMERAERRGSELFDYFLINDDVQAAYKALKTVLRRYPHLEPRVAAEAGAAAHQLTPAKG
mmetsp:Transcript_13336/g.36869  ORF Transcript_13336/g.36869 Transcript_13336/m.36869 type:complete len:201 (+) Transcript_13336:431-1033(+)